MYKLAFFVSALLIFSGTCHSADRFDKYRSACSTKQLAELKAAVDEAKLLATKAASVLPPVESEGGKRFSRWFGGPDGDYDPIVKAVFEEIVFMLKIQKLWCLPSNSSMEKWFKYDAFIVEGKAGEIFVTHRIFDRVASGVGSRGGVLIHEAAHQSTRRDIIDDDIMKQGPANYGWRAAAVRAKESSERARRNADNFRFFAEDVTFGIPNN